METTTNTLNDKLWSIILEHKNTNTEKVGELEKLFLEEISNAFDAGVKYGIDENNNEPNMEQYINNLNNK